MVAARCFSIVGNLGPIAAEALGAYHAIVLSTEMGVQNVILEGDAKMVVQAVNSREINTGKYGQLMDDTKMLLRSFSNWECCYVSRYLNRAAHDLARLACRQIIEKTWVDVIPEAIRDVILMEQSVSI
jgi:ribonuclease HI